MRTLRAGLAQVSSICWLLIGMLMGKAGDQLARGRLPFRRAVLFEQALAHGCGLACHWWRWCRSSWA